MRRGGITRAVGVLEDEGEGAVSSSVQDLSFGVRLTPEAGNAVCSPVSRNI